MAWGLAPDLGQAGKDLWEGKDETLTGAKGLPVRRALWGAMGLSCGGLGQGVLAHP